jgi:hypothetical protein
VVEHRLAKARVAGSSPVSRSRWLPGRRVPKASSGVRVNEKISFFACESRRSSLKVALARLVSARPGITIVQDGAVPKR